MKPKQFWVIVKPDGKTAVCYWNRTGFHIEDDPRTPEEIEASAVDRGHEVHYCGVAHGIGTKTIDELCKRLGYDWDGRIRITVHRD